jgi:DNA gyrase subunit A
LVLTVSETGYGRLSPISDYRIQSRGGKGLTNYHVEKYGDVAAIKVVDLDDDVIIISSDGIIIRIQANTIRQCARPSKGVRVMRILESGENKVVTLARAPHDDDEVDDVEIEDDGSAEDEEDAVDEAEETAEIQADKE